MTVVEEAKHLRSVAPSADRTCRSTACLRHRGGIQCLSWDWDTPKRLRHAREQTPAVLGRLASLPTVRTLYLSKADECPRLEHEGRRTMPEGGTLEAAHAMRAAPSRATPPRRHPGSGDAAASGRPSVTTARGASHRRATASSSSIARDRATNAANSHGRFVVPRATGGSVHRFAA